MITDYIVSFVVSGSDGKKYVVAYVISASHAIDKQDAANIAGDKARSVGLTVHDDIPGSICTVEQRVMYERRTTEWSSTPFSGS